MDIKSLLGKLSDQKASWFKYRNNCYYYEEKRPQSDEEFLNRVATSKTLSGLKEWERTEEYQKLLAIYTESQMVSDLKDVYDTLLEKAKEGDDKAVKSLLQVSHKIKEYSVDAKKAYGETKKEPEDEYAGFTTE
ncbi:hypothetical protein ACI2JA_19840 [Alkalihalobacillus sp. NPDC078783]|uniref:hypothetical protein n=1 Tax=Streptomyces albidoflavus TaxID=1886 RepID=UPI003400E2EC